MNNQETETETFFNINNPAIIKHKERPSKRLKSNAEKSVFKQGKQVLRDSTNIIEEETNETNSTMGRKCEKCKQYGHYAKTCQNVV